MTANGTRPHVLLLLPFLHYGVGRLILDLIEALQERGIACGVVTCGGVGEMGDDPVMVERIRELGASCHTVDIFSRDPSKMEQAAREVGELWNQCKPMLAHAFTAPAAAAALAHGPVMATVVGWGQQKQIWQKQMDVEILDRCAMVTAVSQAMTAELLASGLQRSTVALIRNGVQLGLLSHRRWARGERVRIGCMAHLIHRKGVDILLKALPLVSSPSPLELMIAGEGEAERDLKQLATTLPPGIQIRWLGELPVSDFFPEIDMLVVPSRSDALPLILLQAMAWGLPIVATSVGGIPEAINDGIEGLLVQPDVPSELASAISRYAVDPEMASRCASGARRRAEREFSADAMIRQYLQCYCELIPSLCSFLEFRWSDAPKKEIR
jgi:glycosyltransferase involved in cell wall biosynthesis